MHALHNGTITDSKVKNLVAVWLFKGAVTYLLLGLIGLFCLLCVGVWKTLALKIELC